MWSKIRETILRVTNIKLLHDFFKKIPKSQFSGRIFRNIGSFIKITLGTIRRIYQIKPYL